MKDRYDIKGKIGQGGIGAVYSAWDKRLNREVAIKRVLPEGGFENEEEAITHLLKEATALSSVQHPTSSPSMMPGWTKMDPTS